MTTADYLNQLEQDREDLVDNLETKGITGLSGDETFTELVPEVLNIPSGGTPSINSYTELKDGLISVMNSYSNYLKGIFNTYPTYTNNSVTLYTPDINYKNYIIQKRSSGKYRVVWINTNLFIGIYDNNNIGYYTTTNGAISFNNTLNYNTTNFNPAPYFSEPSYSVTKAYTSNEFNTIDEIIENMQLQNSSLTYSIWTTNNRLAFIADSPYLIPYSNTLLWDERNTHIPINSQRISNNETIVAIS